MTPHPHEDVIRELAHLIRLIDGNEPQRDDLLRPLRRCLTALIAEKGRNT